METSNLQVGLDMNRQGEQKKVVVTSEQTASPPNYPKLRFKIDRKYLIYYLSFIILITGMISLGFFLKMKLIGKGTTQFAAVNCDLSGQKEEVETDIDKSRQAGGFDEEEHSRLIARLLKKDPLVIEVLDRDPWSNFVRDSLGIEDELSAREDVFDELETLEFGDIFEAKQYSYLVGGIELGMASGVYDIKKFGGEPDYYHRDLSNFPGFSRTGVLIRYYSFELGTLIIYKDGTVYFKDKDGNVLEEEKLSTSDINNLLKLFRQINFDALESKDNYAQYEPAVTLICNRYQNILIKDKENTLKPLLREFEKLILDLQENFEFQIKYEDKVKVEIIDWSLKEFPLSDIKKYHDEALAYYRSTGKVKEDSPSYTEIPAEVLSVLTPLASIDRGPFFKSEGKVYLVSEGYGCTPDSEVCKNNTLYTIGAKEITEPSDKLGDIHVWSNSIGVSLGDIPKGGRILSKGIYEQNKAFFDKLGEGLGTRFLEGEYIYVRVRLYRVDLVQKTKQADLPRYLLKVYSKHKLIRWEGSKPLDYYEGMYLKRDQDSDTRFLELKNIIPDEIKQLPNTEAKFYFEDKGEYYYIASLSTDTIFVNKIPKSRAAEGFFTGYLIWNDPLVKLSDITEKGIMVKEKFVEDNELKIQFREDKYYIEGDYLYILDVSNEPQ